MVSLLGFASKARVLFARFEHFGFSEYLAKQVYDADGKTVKYRSSRSQWHLFTCGIKFISDLQIPGVSTPTLNAGAVSSLLCD